MKILSKYQPEENEEHWISASDLMAGLMIVFLFISIAFILDKTEEIEKKQTKSGADQLESALVELEKSEAKKRELEKALEKVEAEKQKFEAKQKELENALKQIFKNDDSIEVEGLIIRFTKIDEFFKQGEFKLRPAFEEKLNEFVPKYFNTIGKYKNFIIEISIDGHTSREWGGKINIPTAHEKKAYTKEQRAYLSNMKLSQDRARVVLDYVLFGNVIGKHKRWVKPILTANGLSSSQVIKEDDKENKELSRRVEFVVVMKGAE